MVLSFYFLFIFFLLGLVFGSFYNVCIYRIPNKLSISFPASHCPKCKNELKWFHNIPLFSYFRQRGKCDFCHQKISFRYPFVELLTGLLFAYCWFHNDYQFSWMLLKDLFFVSTAILVIFIDFDHKIIPDRISLPFIPLGVLFSFLPSSPILWGNSVLAGAIGFSLFFIMAWTYEKIKGQMGLGGGDIKLIAGIGTFLGLKGLVFTLFFSSLLGIFSVVVYPPLRKQQIPFGPYLIGAGLLFMFWGTNIIDLYWNWAFSY